MATKKNELAKVETEFGALAAERPDFLKESTRGSEEVGINEITLPRLSIIQDLSPQRKKNEAEYIDGAEEGMAFNTITRELYDGAIFIVPLYMKKEWVLWKDRKKGGGFGGAFDSEPEANQAKVAMAEKGENPNDYEVLDTHQHFVYVVKGTLDNPVLEEAVISCSKSTMKMSRSLNTLCKLAGGDRFSKIYKLEVVQDQNKAGDSYFNWKVAPLGFVNEAIYKAAEQTYEAIAAGERKVDTPDTEGKKTDSDEDFIDDM